MKRKPLILLTALVLSVAIIMAGTYAWFWDTDEVANEFVLANLGAKITEVYEPRLVVPGLEIDKNVTISNDKSNIPILVRVSFSEVLENLLVPGRNGIPEIFWANEALDLSQSANSARIPLMASAEFIATVKATGSGWESVSYGSSDLKIFRKVAQNANEDTFYTYFAYIESTGQLAQLINVTHNAAGGIASATIQLAYNTIAKLKSGPVDISFVSGTAANTGAWDPACLGNLYLSTEISEYLTFLFGTSVTSGIPAAKNTKQWFYYDGYFYYNTLLEPGQESAQLLAMVKFSETLPNRFQGATYTLIPYLEALQPTAAALIGQWNLTATDAAYLQLKDMCDAYMNGTWTPSP
ncbi:MAG: CalY family protein [Oscillospiraceae bacterium]|nr:CalY family protein [Oscillospiraceae bacterium]